MSPRFELLSVGHALVDIVVTVDDAQLAATGLEPGTMTLIGPDEGERLYRAATAGDGRQVAGGSAANTAVGVAALGGSVAFAGRVADDELGRVFADDLRKAGVVFESPAAPGAPATGRCVVFVTPDGQRTMRTYLGAAPAIGVECVADPMGEGAGTVYLEGYLWDAESATDVRRRAVELAAASGSRLSLTLSDPGCVERHHDDFTLLIDEGAVDVLFANEVEAMALTGADTFDRAVESVRGRCAVAALTRSERGSVVVTATDTVVVPAHPADAVVDTTGAGDLYAAGFLHGLSRGLELADCARLGGLAAARVIAGFGARPEGDLRAEAVAAGLL